MISEIGNLKDYWHVIALTKELKPGRSLKRRLYGHPFLVWRALNGKLHALTDCCAHQKSPIEVEDYQNNRIVCPYHGWEYNETGKLLRVPSSPGACEKLKCSIDHFSIDESDGFVWIGLEPSRQPTQPRPNLNQFEGRGWKTTCKAKLFSTNDLLLIDNFMDPTHTGPVHDGLIRNRGEETTHQLTITSNRNGVKVDFKEREESVGFGMRLLFGRSMKVRHRDEFLPPNLVRVIYDINGKTRFIAFIACNSVEGLDSGKTRALVQLRYRFGWLNHIASPLVSLLADKVLAQDDKITRLQFANQRSLPDLPKHLVAADAVSNKVAKLRTQIISGDSEIKNSTQQIELMF